MRTTLLLGLTLSVFCVACDTGGIAHLREKRDSLVACTPNGPTSTWLRSVTGATEILVLGSTDPLAEIPPASAQCFARGKILYNSETSLETGSYAMDASHVATLTHTDEYIFKYQPSVGVLGREGATRTTLAMAAVEMQTMSMNGTKLVVMAADGQPQTFTSLAEIIDDAKANESTQAGAEDIFRLFNLPLFTSQVRLLGFGSGRMTQYAGITAPFNGLIASYFTVSVESPTAPTTHMFYYQFQDLTGIVIDGEQDTIVGINAKGHMAGTLSFVMVGTGGDAMPAIRGGLDYSMLTINNGMAGGGTYSLTIQGQSSPFTIDYTLATDIDLTKNGLLPLDTNSTP